MTDRPQRAHRDFLVISDFSKSEIDGLFALAERMRRGEYTAKPLAGKTLGMIFTKSSTRTRVSFEVGAYQLGGHALFLATRDVQLGRGEPVADTARVLSRMVDGIVIRTFAHSEIEEFARHADVPVIDGLTDFQHPCQILADLLTVRQHLGTIKDRKVAWIGDGNNMANSWIDSAHVLGFELALACPEGYDPDAALLARAKSAGNVTLHRDPRDAVAGAHVVNTDVWASMGQEEEQKIRERAFTGFTVDAALMKRAAPDAIFLHCLPAHRGEEASAEVIDGPQSRVWDEAENRLHIQKAIMAVLMGGGEPPPYSKGDHGRVDGRRATRLMPAHVVLQRTVTIAPTLETMAELYLLSREGGPKSERFLAYVKRVEHEWGLVSYNPMAGAAALEAVQQAIALDAEPIARQAASDTIADCEYKGTVTLAVVVASAGMWTDRLATEIEYRTTAKRRADHGQVILWSREGIAAEDVRRESVAETVRTMWTALHGQALTLRAVLSREGLSYALADPKAITPPENDAAIRDALNILGDSTTQGDIVAALYGDAAAEQLGWTSLGISDRGGAQWAAHRAARTISEIGEAAALRAG